jgi:hypothetical protein
MAGPDDQGAADAAAGGYLRASHADREYVIDVLKVAFVHGRLTKSELDARVGQTFASQTYGELAALTADLPPGLITAPRRRRSARTRTWPPVSNVAAGAALVIPAPAVVAAAFLAGSELLDKVAALVVLVYFMAWMVAGAQILASWRDRRSRGQLPPHPAQGGQPLEGEPGGRPGDDLFLCQARRHTRARRLPGYSVTQPI